MRDSPDGIGGMKIYTATERRPEIAEVWCRAVAATLQTPHEATIWHHGRRPDCHCKTQEIPFAGRTVSIFGMKTFGAKKGVRMFLEEDMIPVRPWSVDCYPGRLLYAEGYPGKPWPALTLQRDAGEPAIGMVPQRYVREGGCPDWLPEDLCEPALRANAKVLGEHFLHLDKMYRTDVKEAAEKNALLGLLKQRFAAEPPARPGLGDIVAAGLSAVGITPERVSALTGKSCGCKKRKEQLNELGRRFGIG